MASLLVAVQDLVMKCRSIFRSHGTLIFVSGIASVLALKALRLVKRTKVDLHAVFGGPNHLLPTIGFIPKSLDHLWHALEIYADTYGDIYHIKLVGTDLVVASKPDSIRQVLNERPKTYMRLFNKEKIMPTPGMFNTEGEEWKRNRRLGAPAFNDKNSDAMVPDMSEVALKLVRQLRSLSQNDRIVWRPTEWLPLCTLDVLCVTTFGHDLDFLNLGAERCAPGAAVVRRSGDIQQAMADALAGSDYAAGLRRFPWMTRDRFPWNLNPMIRKMHTGVKGLNRICDEIISSRRAEQQAAARGGRVERRDLLDKLLHLDPVDLRGNLVTFLIAGSDTTAMTLSWCLYYLSLNPQFQTKARAEVDALGHDPKTIADLNRLSYVECCILEALRLQPPGLLLFNECIADTSIEGHRIPRGTVVATLLHKAMVAEAQGGTTFGPERWLTNDGVSIDQSLVRDHLAFGGGPRQCPGQNMAIKEATIILALILRNFGDIKLTHSPSCVHGKAIFTYGPENLELQMYQRSC